MYKIEVQEDNGLWHDVRDAGGQILTYPSSAEAHAGLEKLFPALVGLERYEAGPKRTRVISILTDDDE